MDEQRSCLERRYWFRVEQVRHEAIALWRVSQVFLLPLVALMAFVLSALFGGREIRHLGLEGINPWGVFLIALVGFVLSLVWLASTRRSLEIFDTRTNSIVKLGKKLDEELKEGLKKEEECLPGWNVYDEPLRGWWRIRYSIYTLVGVFLVIYGGVLLWELFIVLYPCIKR